MKTPTKQVVLISLIAAFMAAATVIRAQRAETSPPSSERALPIRGMEMDPVFNLRDERSLVGYSHNVFVGTVTKELGLVTNTPSDSTPYPRTAFQVNVLTNVKGRLEGNVIVRQVGGVVGGYYRRVNSDNPADPDALGLLAVGSTYLFATRQQSQSMQGVNSVMGTSSARILITTQTNLTKEQLSSFAEPSIAKMKEAYVNEQVPTTTGRGSPIAASLVNPTNLFRDLPPAGQARLKAEVEAYKKSAPAAQGQ